MPAKIAAQMAAVDAAGRREAKGYADCLMQAIRTGDCDALYQIGTCDDFWAHVFRRIGSGRRCHQRRDQGHSAVVSARA